MTIYYSMIKTKKDDLMDVLYTVDNRYLDILLASIYSLLCNGNIKNLKIHIITSHFSKNDYQKIELFFKEFDVEYYFYPLETFKIEDYHIPEWKNSQIANARLFFQDIMKQSIDHIDHLLYLDSDTIVVDDLNDIHQYNNGIFAVKDGGRLKRDYMLLGNIKQYYNSGVLFINVSDWIHHDCQGKIIHALEQNTTKLVLPDQDLLNIALSDQLNTLPFRYNIPPYAYLFNNLAGKLYFNNAIKNIDYNEIKLEKNNPKIIHSYGLSNIKPWQSTMNPFHDEYMKYILAINSNFQMEELNKVKKIITRVPTLYYLLVLARGYLPNIPDQSNQYKKQMH